MYTHSQGNQAPPVEMLLSARLLPADPRREEKSAGLAASIVRV